MCGICGVVSFYPTTAVEEEVVRRMNQTLYHRGPDDEGYYQDAQASLAMRRLSIIDLHTGKQPISNEVGTIWTVYNGEIYNFRQVRSQLEELGHTFRTQTDTEIIVHAYEEFGDACVTQFNGMFAIALWDSYQKKLLLARDRLGIKPLYYYEGHDKLVFGSELKSLLAHPNVPRNIDLTALDLFLTLEYIPAPRTIFQDIYKLMPGHTLNLERGKVSVSQYWEVPYNPLHIDNGQCAEHLETLIKDAVKIRLMSDVPLGAFLSGGIDSSTIVGYMSQLMAEPVQTFSIGFEDDTYNELSFANAVAKHFQTNHHYEVLKPDIAVLAEQLVRHHDEPFADTSIIPTYLVSKLAGKEVKVVLSGDGGDELFAGYDTYLAQRLDRYYGLLSGSLRRDFFPAFAKLLPPQPEKKGMINKIKRMIEGGALDPSLQHTRWMTFLTPSDRMALYQPDLYDSVGNQVSSFIFSNYFKKASRFDSLAQQQFVDIKTYLTDDILTKVDRMSMALSIEARVPLLDYRIVEFALNLPPHLKLNGSRTKVILRNAVKGLLPDIILNKPKQGFSIPMKQWLRDSLKELMLDLLSKESVQRRGYFNPAVVSKWVEEHLRESANHSHRLWALMVLEMWHRNEAAPASIPHRISI